MGDGDVDVIVKAVQNLFDSVKNPSLSLGLYRTFIDVVPSGLRDLSPTSFNPRVVSIGPLHKDEQHLQPFDEQKVKYAHKLLYSPDYSLPNQMLKECVEKVVAKTDRIRACYDKIKMEKYNDTELAKMMVIDACFILEYLGRSEFNVENRSFWRGQSIVYDMVLVENQIPFFILQDIFDSTILKSEPTASLTTLLLPLVQICNIFETSLTANITPRLNFQDHILGFLENCFHPSRNNSPSEGLPSSAIHSAVELDRAGVIFKPNNPDETWSMAMEFKSCPLSCFSWCWVDTEEDIAKLIESKVVLNHLGSNEKAADMINSLCKQQPIRMFCYVDQWQDMDTHYNNYWPKNIAALKRTYFSSPWSMITLVGGIALFVLTVIQTIYAVRAR
ncbi:unnamed protein product [Lactuca saligna]|uniref:Uncharacterized protein n=1 Tax=Lactuca saligna TaxID=75948 RepID=A0AA36EK28_LACSI|nr:unnamed protein product [Lactuca saligna]